MSSSALNAPGVYIRLSEERSFLCTATHKIIPKALECDKSVLCVKLWLHCISECDNPVPATVYSSRYYFNVIRKLGFLLEDQGIKSTLLHDVEELHEKIRHAVNKVDSTKLCCVVGIGIAH
ncbi:hypothetical protein TNCV_1583651 [Trichonephila clavipes]|nr:hypothetical protein TNCV_1583651 [Trichonephila clavipes]